MDLTDTLDPTSNGTATPEPGTATAENIGDTNGLRQKEENKFQKAVAAWRSTRTTSVNPRLQLTETLDIDLTTLVPTLDTAASDLVAHQRDSLVQRKDLAQKTKDFRKLDDPGKLNEIKTLLKGTSSSGNALDELVL